MLNGLAAYWKKDVAVQLVDSNIVSKANKIIYENNTTYTAGSKQINGKQQACFWYNDGVVNLNSDGYESDAVDICILNNDVYTCGSIKLPNNKLKACYWVNATLYYLPNVSSNNSYATAMATKFGDVFICGRVVSDGIIGYVWKNGDAIINIPYEQGISNPNLNDIAINTLLD